jgi:hypothetical protein
MPCSCRLQQKLNFHGLVRKNDASIIRAVENSCVKQRSNVTMDGFYITPGAARGFAD